ncbi:MAG: hypothetical protein U0744_11555 [Gemmataceae bacterium]
MSDKLKAVGKIAMGVAQTASGIATATGHGIVGSFLRNHGAAASGMRLGTESAKKGMKAIEDGIRDYGKARD